eukprot:TRINITY_DN47851_c0_g1_i1.p1 TRINITY_DN47851_c0_g1~~TRINITY_DN47851_c0_g1_i1.p1  ORF type:complete len:327 (-),score=10.74 TRINITY_DN47851_c0_g1_i1:255-1235(-)
MAIPGDLLTIAMDTFENPPHTDVIDMSDRAHPFAEVQLMGKDGSTHERHLFIEPSAKYPRAVQLWQSAARRSAICVNIDRVRPLSVGLQTGGCNTVFVMSEAPSQENGFYLMCNNARHPCWLDVVNSELCVSGCPVVVTVNVISAPEGMKRKIKNILAMRRPARALPENKGVQRSRKRRQLEIASSESSFEVVDESFEVVSLDSPTSAPRTHDNKRNVSSPVPFDTDVVELSSSDDEAYRAANSAPTRQTTKITDGSITLNGIKYDIKGKNVRHLRDAIRADRDNKTLVVKVLDDHNLQESLLNKLSNCPIFGVVVGDAEPMWFAW